VLDRQVPLLAIRQLVGVQRTIIGRIVSFR